MGLKTRFWQTLFSRLRCLQNYTIKRRFARVSMVVSSLFLSRFAASLLKVKSNNLLTDNTRNGFVSKIHVVQMLGQAMSPNNPRYSNQQSMMAPGQHYNRQQHSQSQQQGAAGLPPRSQMHGPSSE